jgi:hypothetical protein
MICELGGIVRFPGSCRWSYRSTFLQGVRQSSQAARFVTRPPSWWRRGVRPTMDTFVDSSWYYAHFICDDETKIIDTPLANRWLPVDQYIGGIEHAILHLLYARFINRAATWGYCITKNRSRASSTRG